MLALGLMTGTALDGFIDAALIRTDGVEVHELGSWRLHPYGGALRTRLAQAVAAARAWEFRGAEPTAIAAVGREYTLALAEAVHALLGEADVPATEVEVVGMHGLTVLHRPDPSVRRTRQLGDGELLARELGMDVAYDFRAADVAAGGQGAPLAPVYHAALLRYARCEAPAVALNLGGVANVSYWGGADDIVAFDTGPANGPINEWMERNGRGAFDVNGACAAGGQVDEALLARLLEHPFFARSFPKSLDRFDFSADLVRGLSLEDGAATLTAFSAAAVGRGLDLLPARPRELIVCGGGRKNPVLMRELDKRTGARAIDSDSVGWRGDAVEAEVFAFLAVRVLKGLPLSFPATTGVPRAMTGGRIARGRGTARSAGDSIPRD
jgi:anhydro-N-acetylmuramic acid kinase